MSLPIIRPSFSRHAGASVECDGAGLLVLLGGEHDLATVADVSAVLAAAIAAHDGDLAVDLSGVTFMDASTVGVLLRCRRYLANRSRSLVVRSLSPQSRRVLALSGVLELLTAQQERGDRAHSGATSHEIRRTRAESASGTLVSAEH